MFQKNYKDLNPTKLGKGSSLSRAFRVSLGAAAQTAAQAVAFCKINPLGISELRLVGFGVVVPAPVDQNNTPYQNHYNTPAQDSSLLESDRLAIADFLKKNIGGFQEHIAELDMDPEDAERIIGGLR